jgi:hypothetical protein
VAHNETNRARLGAAIVAIAPAVLLAGLVSHPYIAILPDDAAVARAVSADPTRWAISHLTVGVGSGLLAVAFIAIRSYLRDAGEERFSAWGLPFVVMGSVLYGLLPGMEFAPLAAGDTADPAAVQAALNPWFIPTLLTSVLLFAVGVLGIARGIVDSRVLSRRTTTFVVGALAIMAVGRVVPVGALQFYMQGAAGVLALWPLAARMWQEPQTRHTASSRAVPVT